MLASAFEFRHRTWFILGIFCVGLDCYLLDSQNSGVVLAEALHSHIGYSKGSVLKPLSESFSL